MKIAQIETAIDSYHAHHSKSAVQRRSERLARVRSTAELATKNGE